MAITRITAVWTGFRGAPGYSNFHFAGAFGDGAEESAAAEAVRNFFVGFSDWVPSAVSVTIDPVARIIDEASGVTQNEIDLPEIDPVAGGGGQTYSAASGAVVNWNTSAYRNGRRVRGRTFLVPLTVNAYDNNGDLTQSALTSIRGATDYLTSGASLLPFVVWARPVNGGGGSAEPVTSATVPDLGAILRSRRD